MVIAADWTDVDLDQALSSLAVVSARLAAPGAGREELMRAACLGARRVLDAEDCRFVEGGEGAAAFSVAAAVGRPAVGWLVAERDGVGEQDQQLLEVIASQLGLALARSDLAERLTEEHLVRDLFDAVAEGRHAQAERRARAAGHDLARPHVVLVLEPAGGRADWAALAAHAEQRLRRLVPGALCDPGDDHLRALVPTSDLATLDSELARAARELGVVAGRSSPQAGLASAARGLQEATTAARVARATTGGARAYDDLGAYRYLAQLPAGHAPDERHARAIATLAAYDERRRTDLLQTLERHLGDRGALAATARSLYIHTNTLRQRLDRIESLTGLDLSTEDLLSLELALKLARLYGPQPRELAQG